MPRTRTRSIRLLSSVTILLAACAAPMTQMGGVSSTSVKAEQTNQHEFALRSQIKEQNRLEDVAYPLLRGAVSLCGSAAGRRAGMWFANAATFKKSWASAARALGFGDTVSLLHVAPGSGADRAGLRDGDRILALNGKEIAPGPQSARAFAERLSALERDHADSVRLTFRRDSVDAIAVVPLDTVCAYDVVLQTSQDLNAWADGEHIVVTTAMLRFVADDDELATVLAHETAHDAMRHIQAKKKNALFGAILGAVADVAVASGGYNTGGEFARQGAQAGAMVFSQDFEREADYVGLYIMALAGRSIDHAPDLWRRMAAESPQSIKFASSHPTTAERFVRLEHWIAEIHEKQATGEALRPEMKAQARQ